ncbi:membrane protein A39 [Aotine betaherpesvirus 1]|uniref:Membrane protein A39 n=1 Tax=Aotine betaherpesvirus 1 TaxID=50290 RepID=G8XUL7_9BETA|nr:membrane protein A39 [Aotine betaherpesvirus 1]AEV80859.1 membrane protein A39 [Aotine betaherpesvirus 1]
MSTLVTVSGSSRVGSPESPGTMMQECSQAEYKAVRDQSRGTASVPQRNIWVDWQPITNELNEEHRRHLCLVYILFLGNVWVAIVASLVSYVPILRELVRNNAILLIYCAILVCLMYLFIQFYEHRHPWNPLASVVYVTIGICVGVSTTCILSFYKDTFHATLSYGCTFIAVLFILIFVSRTTCNLSFALLVSLIAGAPMIMVVGLVWLFHSTPGVTLVLAIVCIGEMALMVTFELYQQWHFPLEFQLSPMTRALNLFMYVTVLCYVLFIAEYYMIIKSKTHTST